MVSMSIMLIVTSFADDGADHNHNGRHNNNDDDNDEYGVALDDDGGGGGGDDDGDDDSDDVTMMMTTTMAFVDGTTTKLMVNIDQGRGGGHNHVMIGKNVMWWKLQGKQMLEDQWEYNDYLSQLAQVPPVASFVRVMHDAVMSHGSHVMFYRPLTYRDNESPHETQAYDVGRAACIAMLQPQGDHARAVPSV